MGDGFKGLRLHNTLTRSKEYFVPIDPQNVRMYVCGPTVYDFAHIGNARPVIVFDVLYRLLRHLYGEDHVTYVRNITDVEDKINDRALRDFGAEIAAGTMSLNAAISKVTETTADQFHKDVAALGCLEPTFEPRATQHIDGMVAMAQTLLDKGHAYVASGTEGREVLFDVSTMPAYGKLSNRRLEDQQAGARVEVTAHKKNTGDFVLWKESSKDQPGWPAHFHVEGKAHDIFGRPGWHIECSVMSRHHLGEVFDIHGGGLDLIFPHHENEIAQSRCAHGTDTMANIWMHNGYLQVEGRKMSKSEGNFVTIHDLLHTEKFGGRPWHGKLLRFVMLNTSYKEPIDWSVRSLTQARRELFLFADAIRALRQNPPTHSTRELDSEFLGHLLNDLDTHSAIDRLTHLRKLAARNRAAADALLGALEFLNLMDVDSVEYFDEGYLFDPDLALGSNVAALVENFRVASANNSPVLASSVLSEIDSWGARLVEVQPGLVSINKKGQVETEAEFTSRLGAEIDRRLSLLRDKNFADADRIRDELAGQGIQLMDYKDPETGERRTKWEVKR